MTRDQTAFREGGFSVWVVLFGFFVLSSAWILCPVTVYAHPPEEITLSHNGETKKLEVTLVHTSSFPRVHYIKKIVIKRNGIPAGFFQYQSQTDKSKFSYTYDVPGVKGDEIEVTAFCSLYGSRTVRITIGM